MAHFKRGYPHRQVRCTICSDNRWLGNNTGRFTAKEEQERSLDIPEEEVTRHRRSKAGIKRPWVLESCVKLTPMKDEHSERQRLRTLKRLKTSYYVEWDCHNKYEKKAGAEDAMKQHKTTKYYDIYHWRIRHEEDE